MSKFQISVIVPAYNEEAVISACLKALIKQKFPKNDYEIIVVDNNSTDRTAKIAQKFSLRLVKEKRQGLTFARMRGIKESRGEIIAFTDADTIVKPQWLSKIREIYQKNPKIIGLGLIADIRPKNLWASIIQLGSGIGLKFFKILPGYNFSFKKSAYLKSGGYSSSFDMGEDVYISKKMDKIGKLLICKTGLVITSARRFQDFRSSFRYFFKSLIASFSILLFDRSPLRLGAVRKEENFRKGH